MKFTKTVLLPVELLKCKFTSLFLPYMNRRDACRDVWATLHMSLPYISRCVPSIHVGIVRSTSLLFLAQEADDR